MSIPTSFTLNTPFNPVIADWLRRQEVTAEKDLHNLQHVYDNGDWRKQHNIDSSEWTVNATTVSVILIKPERRNSFHLNMNAQDPGARADTESWLSGRR